jgi:hypothetical protein
MRGALVTVSYFVGELRKVCEAEMVDDKWTCPCGSSIHFETFPGLFIYVLIVRSSKFLSSSLTVVPPGIILTGSYDCICAKWIVLECFYSLVDTLQETMTVSVIILFS